MFNVERPKQAPASLAKKQKYDDHDVWELLESIFFSKCYLCERKDLSSINVEHLVHHGGDKDLRFKWENLFFSCSYCNQVKGVEYDDILDCTDNSIQIWKKIVCIPPLTQQAKEIKISAYDDDPKTIKTAELISKIFNLRDTGNRRIVNGKIKTSLFNRLNSFQEDYLEYLNQTTPIERKEYLLEKLKRHVSKETDFSAFIRWMVHEDYDLSEILEPYFD